MIYNHIFQLGSLNFYSIISKYIYYPRLTLICFLCCLILIILPKINYRIRAILLGTASGLLSYLSMIYLSFTFLDLILKDSMGLTVLFISVYGIPCAVIFGIIVILINLNLKED